MKIILSVLGVLLVGAWLAGSFPLLRDRVTSLVDTPATRQEIWDRAEMQARTHCANDQRPAGCMWKALETNPVTYLGWKLLCEERNCVAWRQGLMVSMTQALGGMEAPVSEGVMFVVEGLHIGPEATWLRVDMLPAWEQPAPLSASWRWKESQGIIAQFRTGHQVTIHASMRNAAGEDVVLQPTIPLAGFEEVWQYLQRRLLARG